MNATTCNYSSFVLLATAPRALPNHTVSDRFGGWSLIDSPIFPPPCLPKPPCHPPAQTQMRGFEGLGRVSAAWESPRGGKGAPGVAHGQQAPSNDATEALGHPGGPQARGGPGNAVYRAGNVPCNPLERLPSAAPWQHRGC